jgi:4-hydroxybenzoyl-CoA reductase subunit alpha
MGVSGFASGIRLGTLSDSGVVIRVNEDGTITMLCGDADVGQGSDTMMAMVAAEVLGITPEDVHVISADTGACPFAPGTFGSRVTMYGGNAAREAAEDVKQQLAQIAARMLEVPQKEITFKNKMVMAKGDKQIPFPIVVKVAQMSNLLGGQGVIVGKGSYSPPNIEFPDRDTQEGNIAGAYSFAAQVAEVEVDKETGQVKLLNMALGDDCGQPINALACDGQTHGCAHMGQGQAMFEQVLMDEGVVLNPNLRDYKIPTAMDTPHMETLHIHTNDPVGPFGAKEIGEGFIVSTPAAIGNAIHDATGVWIKDLPITPERIVKALEEQKKKKKGGKG